MDRLEETLKDPDVQFNLLCGRVTRLETERAAFNSLVARVAVEDKLRGVYGYEGDPPLSQCGRAPDTDVVVLKRARNSARDAILLKAMMVARNPEVKCYMRELREAVDAYDEVNDAYQDVRKPKQRGGGA
ncbi:MAG TPA: hypothetical protein VMS08_06150 [Candidatus Saccharimonadia bacterium]|nr:hypothetical protein [Candidatus Saccharimonadia bacterium]